MITVFYHYNNIALYKIFIIHVFILQIIGSSLLIIHDGKRAGAWMIDFAKTVSLPESIKTDHRSLWSNGNHEDGYLTGLDNLILVSDLFKH